MGEEIQISLIRCIMNVINSITGSPRRLFRYTTVNSSADKNRHLWKEKTQTQLLKLLFAERCACSTCSPGYCINTVLGKIWCTSLWLHDHLNSASLHNTNNNPLPLPTSQVSFQQISSLIQLYHSKQTV